MKRAAPGQPVVNSIQVDSIDEFAKRIVESGGEIVVPKMPIGSIGYA
jgi:predicted enzyme related to lactoylglutathione lyase